MINKIKQFFQGPRGPKANTIITHTSDAPFQIEFVQVNQQAVSIVINGQTVAAFIGWVTNEEFINKYTNKGDK